MIVSSWNKVSPKSVNVFVLILLFLATCEARADRLSIVDPAEVGLSAERLKGVEGLALEGIAQAKMPGCVVCVGRHGKIAYLEAFGNKQSEPDEVPMTTDTVFDMASITKPVATATSIMKLVENGQIRLGSKVAEFFPEFGQKGKELITIQDLLVHQSGLIPDNSIRDYEDGPDVAWQRICELGLVAPVGETFKYSDVNFIVLAEIVRKVSGKDVHEYSKETIFQPLGMLETGYNPSDALKLRSAPTEQRDGKWMRGTVHDPRAYALGGVAGHAGLFSTAEDLALYAQMMLDRGRHTQPDGSIGRILAPMTIAAMTQGSRVSSGIRGLGWDKQTGYSSNRGDLLSDSAFGHGGFTGTVLWMDPELDLFFIFLSNRVHPNGNGSVNHLAGRIANVIVSAIQDAKQPSGFQAKQVLCGIDVLQRHGFRELANQRVGLITNHTGLARDGGSNVELFQNEPSVDLVALFSPEHGFEGKLDVARVADAQDATSGLKIYSLYGETRKPTREMLAEVDTLVFDIQDIGTRFYTYISTMGEAMQAASELGKRFIVLDRPNPINGVDVTGPMLDSGSESFVGFHRLPVRHGLTAGELAKLIASELKLDLDLEVIQCEGWQREDFWEATNLTWVNPSPNMRSLTQSLLYPGIGLLETTNVSVGRGTDTPFEIIGAPWIQGQQLARELNTRQIPGVVFVPIGFTPDASKFVDEACSGVNIVVVDRDAIEPVRVGLELASAMRRLYPDDWEVSGFNRLLGNRGVFDAVSAAQSVDAVLEKSTAGVSDFKRRRVKYLLY